MSDLVENTKEPRLRFKGFDLYWAKKQLDEVSDVERGKFSPRPRNDPQFYGGNTPFVQTGDVVKADIYLREYSQTLNEKGVAVSRVFPAETILITIAANIGDTAITAFPVACPDSLVGIISNDLCDTRWLFYQLSKMKSILLSYATTNAQANINLAVLRPLKFYAPELPEQQKIAAALQSVDDKLTQLRHKQQLLQTYKRGIMQKIFTQQLRFKQDNGRPFPDWEARRLKDCIYEKSNISDATIPLYSLTIENGVTKKTQRYERAFLVKKEGEAYKAMEQNDFAYNPMNLRFGALARHKAPFKVKVSKYYDIFAANETINIEFVETLLKSYDSIQFYNRMATGSLEEKKRVHFSEFLKFKFDFPSLPEQQKIADFLTAIDTKIDAVAQQITQIETFKKGLLQKMFV